MTKKKTVKNPLGVKITKREPGKVGGKTNYLKNLRDFPSLQNHPVEDLLRRAPEDLETQKHGDLETQDLESGNPNAGNLETQIIKLGNPSEQNLETQSEEVGNPEILNLETQNSNFGNPNEVHLETQKIITGNPKPENLETQVEKIGTPTSENLDAIQPKEPIWKPKAKSEPDAIQPKLKNLETQNPEVSEKLKKYEKARSTEPIHVRADKGIAKRVRHFLVDHDFTLKDFFEIAAVKFMDGFGNPNSKNLDANQPYDDRRLKITWKTTPSLINLYLAYNSVLNPKTKWSARDDEAASRFNVADLRLVELGIIQTQANKSFTGKINTFAYYVNEIENFVGLKVSDEGINAMLIVNRQRWQQATKRELDLSFLDLNK